MARPTLQRLVRRIRRAREAVNWQRELVAELQREGKDDAAGRAQELLSTFETTLGLLEATKARMCGEYGFGAQPTSKGNVVSLSCPSCQRRFTATMAAADEFHVGSKFCTCGVQLCAWEGPYDFEFEEEAH